MRVKENEILSLKKSIKVSHSIPEGIAFYACDTERPSALESGNFYFTSFFALMSIMAVIGKGFHMAAPWLIVGLVPFILSFSIFFKILCRFLSIFIKNKRYGVFVGHEYILIHGYTRRIFIHFTDFVLCEAITENKETFYRIRYQKEHDPAIRTIDMVSAKDLLALNNLLNLRKKHYNSNTFREGWKRDFYDITDFGRLLPFNVLTALPHGEYTPENLHSFLSTLKPYRYRINMFKLAIRAMYMLGVIINLLLPIQIMKLIILYRLNSIDISLVIMTFFLMGYLYLYMRSVRKVWKKIHIGHYTHSLYFALSLIPMLLMHQSIAYARADICRAEILCEYIRQVFKLYM